MKPEGIEPGWTPVPVTRFREVYEDPTQVAEIERVISDLRAKRGELSLPGHPAVDVLWKYAEEMHNMRSMTEEHRSNIMRQSEVAMLKLHDFVDSVRKDMGALAGVEILARRAQLIESAFEFANDKHNPDFSHAEEIMGLCENASGFIFDPELRKHVGNSRLR